MRFRAIAACLAVALGLFSIRAFGQDYLEISEAEAFRDLRLTPRAGPWKVEFICYARCDSDFNERVRRTVQRLDKRSAGPEEDPRPLYVVIYSGEVDEGDVLMRLDTSALDALTKPYSIERHIAVNLLFAVDAKSPCESLTYGINSTGAVDLVVIDYIGYGKLLDFYAAPADTLIETCTKASLAPFDR